MGDGREFVEEMADGIQQMMGPQEGSHEPVEGLSRYQHPEAYSRRVRKRTQRRVQTWALRVAAVVCLLALALMAAPRLGIRLPDISGLLQHPDGRAASYAVNPERTEWAFAPSEEKVVYLTFDDGPSENTKPILDILDRYGAKATFFVTDQFPDHRPLIKEAYRRGHTIGLHTASHDYAIYASEEEYLADLEAIGAVVSEQIGYVPCFVRFPGGSSNTISADYAYGIMSMLAVDVPARGYQYWDWNASCGDGGTVSKEEAISTAISEGGEQQNIVMLLHDAPAKGSTVEALPAIIEHYQALGYEFRALTPESYVVHHGINN